MIRISNLTLRRGNFVLDKISFHIKKGEIYLLLGASGAGKTTVLEIVAGFIKPEFGQIIMNGDNIIKLPSNKRNIAYLPQKRSLFPHLSIKENILYGVKAQGISLDRDYYKMLISRLEIEDILKSYPENISGGQIQRAALGRAMIVKPNMLLLDEPFSALHPSLRYDLEELLKSIATEFNLTILAVSHNIDEALNISDVISFMHNGIIMQTAKRNEIYFRPKTIEVAKFFGIKNLFDGKVSNIDEENLRIETIFGTVYAKRTYREKEIRIGEDIIWGIHSDEVRIIRQEHKKARLNRISGRISHVFLHGQYWDIRLLCKSGVLAIRIPDFIYNRLNIEEKKEIEVDLPSERIFVIQYG